MVAVRELQLTGVPDAQRNWVNDHTTYTHGFGVVAAYGNQRNADDPRSGERSIARRAKRSRTPGPSSPGGASSGRRASSLIAV